MGEPGKVFGCGEEARMSGDAAEDECIFVLNFALDDSTAKGAASCDWASARLGMSCRLFVGGGARATLLLPLVGGGGNFRAQGRGRIERGAGHSERTENLALTESVEGFFRDSFKSGAEDDESDVTILCASAGIGRKRHREGRSQELVARVGFEEQPFVGGQARGVSQKHAHRHAAAARIGFAAGVDEEFRDGAEQRRVEFEKASFVQECSHCRGGDDFGD